MMLSRDIKVTRGSILEEVLQVYKESEDVVEDHLQVCFVGEDGIDVGGLDLLKNMICCVLGKSIQDLFHRGKCVCSFSASGKAT